MGGGRQPGRPPAGVPVRARRHPGRRDDRPRGAGPADRCRRPVGGLLAMTGWTLLPYGQSAVLVELAGSSDVLPVREALLARAHPAVLAVVPAARTVLVEFDPSSVSEAELRGL